MLLIGTWRARLDAGRLTLPHSFHRAASDGLTITRGLDRCLQAFPAAAWHDLARRVGDLPLTADAARMLRRLLFGAAVDLPSSPDALLIPRQLLAYAGIGAQAVLVGCDTYFEIWSPEALSAASARPPALDRLTGLVASLAAPAAPAIL
jgi:MraZ protein